MKHSGFGDAPAGHHLIAGRVAPSAFINVPPARLRYGHARMKGKARPYSRFSLTIPVTGAIRFAFIFESH
ncbi:hypothetical protein EPD60_03085 [Flaviaesturariibacter flavus]|uniref:Uncharacterized protein n=1 Tax=Flaviaesturariibacter flavus TaxID=2502780 RepID=A0A4R1BMU5_9BACT|nr:hypothetical protein [Flaviaesturariibacter flavus]TCJ18759.1 hypothetical protein EPD60_03085 [Flaviaesturariibacter flavus]